MTEETNNTHLERTKIKKFLFRKEYKLSDKKFEIRNSLLTDLFENPHISTVYHLFAAILVGLIVNTIAHDLLTTGNAKLGFQLILLSFNKIYIAIPIWFLECFFTYLCYKCFILWAKQRISLCVNANFNYIKIMDYTLFCCVPLYYGLAFKVSSYLTTTFQLPPASSAIVIFEMVRMLMKTHSFIRENAPKVLNYKPNDEDPLELPEFSRFFYFFFAPTLIYRDEYPRTTHIRWNYVFKKLGESICVVLNMCYVIERLIRPTFNTFGERTFTVKEMILCICNMSFAGMLLKLLMFYFILHSWSNLFAEITRFGDRKFYSDWWISTSYGEYFRTWNILVGDWLFTYIYRDTYQFIVPGNKTMAKVVVFVISAVVHEWLMCYMLGFFLPLMFFFFLFLSGPASFVKVPKYNIFNVLFWYFLAFGSGAMVCVYTMEFYARVNRPVENDTFKDFFVPRMFNYITY
ncbi:unnamed protein product [Brassicogethes aeneus]|uniref:O-acyltransferase n=1 Tax=Brassicogethes aeneus TaxID=1431903 RepID=A0A9P0B3X1_BRAAE|nr:unnamed protein product [Brassicogethes aeneus]